MPAGSLRESVTFQRQGTGAGDGKGNLLTSFADITDAIAIPAELVPLRQGETVVSAGVQGRRLYRCTVRWTSVLAAIKITDRMVDARDATRVFNVKAEPINTDKKRKYLEILVEIGGASG